MTPRREWELGLLALQELWKRIPQLEVLFAGWDVSTYEIPFPHKNMGVVSMETLAELYTQSDLCLVISGTNLSLVPLEIMGCARAAVCTKGANSSWMVTEENAVLVDSDPLAIADTMEDYLTHPEKMEEICRKGMEFAAGTDWEKEADKVYEAMKNWIAQDERELQR